MHLITSFPPHCQPAGATHEGGSPPSPQATPGLSDTGWTSSDWQSDKRHE